MSTEQFETLFHDDLKRYLLGLNEIDERLPETPDIDELWSKIGKSFLNDGMREFQQYPTVPFGWCMYIGMAIAKYWDEDWELYSQVDDLYVYLRDKIDFDHMDDYIRDIYNSRPLLPKLSMLLLLVCARVTLWVLPCSLNAWVIAW